MTPRHKFPATVRSDHAPDPDALVDFVEAVGFIVATKRTRALLNVLAKTGLLSKRLRTVKHDDGTQVRLERYMMKGKAE